MMLEIKPMTGKELADLRAKAIEELDLLLDALGQGKHALVMFAHLDENNRIQRSFNGCYTQSFYLTVVLLYLEEFRKQQGESLNDFAKIFPELYLNIIKNAVEQ